MKTLEEDLEIIRRFLEKDNSEITREEAIKALEEIEARLSWMGIKTKGERGNEREILPEM